MYVYKYTDACAHIYTHAPARVHTHTHTRAHTHTQARHKRKGAGENACWYKGKYRQHA